MSRIELSLDTTREAVDWVCTLLADAAYDGNIRMAHYGAGLAESDDLNALEGAIAPSRDRDSPDWAFTLYLDLQADQSHQYAILEQALNPLVRTGIATPLRPVSAAESAAVQTDGQVLKYRVGQRFVISAMPLPSRDYGDQDLPLYIPPSLAFGSGCHPATQLSLQLLERSVRPAMSVLDLGSGSGILSVAMAKLGAQVLAIDNDDVAVQASQDAVRRNGLISQVTVMKASLGEGSDLGHWMGGEIGDAVEKITPKSTFNLIAANILARVHIALAADFRQSLQPEGLLMTAGFTVDYEEDVRAALSAVGFETIAAERSQDWVALLHRLTA
jgi:ribosomal protein L11 methyltransferase